MTLEEKRDRDLWRSIAMVRMGEQARRTPLGRTWSSLARNVDARDAALGMYEQRGVPLYQAHHLMSLDPSDQMIVPRGGITWSVPFNKNAK